MSEVSIIIPVRNQKASLFLMLDSLRHQIKRPRAFEVVICDDCSTDGTGDRVKRLRYPIFLKYFRNDPALGRAGNRNAGFEKSSGSRLIFLDGDMVPAAGYIDAMLSGDDNSARVGVAMPAQGESPCRFSRYLYSRGRYDTRYHNAAVPGRYFTSNSFFISRENYLKTGGFDANFRSWGGEDMDLGMRLETFGIPIVCESNAVSYHHHERTIASLAEDFYNFGAASFGYLLAKHPELLDQIPLRRLGISLPAHKINPLNRLVSWISVNQRVLHLAQALASRYPKLSLPDAAYDFIIWGNLALGYKNRHRIAGAGG